MWIDDQILHQCSDKTALKIWQPETKTVVLGSGNKSELECNEYNCLLDGVNIKKRYGGGGTVLLDEKCLVISFGCWVKDPYKNSYYFSVLNQSLINVLKAKWMVFEGLSQNGISDISFSDRKTCGTSLFRSRNYLLFQASILVEDSIEDIAKYLLHPTKEPDYRGGKSHRDFLTCLKNIEDSADYQSVKKEFEDNLEAEFYKGLRDEFVDPEERQIKHIKARALRT